MTDLLGKIRTHSTELTAKQLRLAKCIEENINDLSYMNASQLAKKAGVSEATVTRFVRLLGYGSVAQFLQNVQDSIRSKASLTVDRYRKIQAENSLLAETFELEKSIMDETLNHIDADLFAACVDMLHGAPDVLVVGCPPCDCLSLYASFFMRLYRPNVHELRNYDLNLFNTLDGLGPDFVTLVFSFPRYPSETRIIMDAVSRKSSRVIAVTDSLLSPLIPFAEKVLLVPQKFVSNLDTYAAVMALIHSLILGVYLKDAESSNKRLRRYDALIKTEKLMDHEDVEIVNLMKK